MGCSGWYALRLSFIRNKLEGSMFFFSGGGIMKKRFWIAFTFLLVIPGFMFPVSCAKKPVACGPAWVPDVQKSAVATPLAQEVRVAAVEEQPPQAGMVKPPAKEEFPDEDVHFEYDKSNLLPEAQENLRAKAKWLQENPDVSVVIEGHCDERGSSEYNMALGDRRAGSAKTFLIGLGIAAQRITAVSYGKEKPLDPGHDEAAWAKNRRAHFVIE